MCPDELPANRTTDYRSGAFPLIWLILLTLTAMLSESAWGASPAFLEIGKTRQLFVDAYIIQSLTDARQVLNQAQKHPESPALKQDRPWEGNLIQTGAVLYDGDAKLFKMWYYTGQYFARLTPNGPVTETVEGSRRRAYAFSRDGVHWEKPNLGRVEFQGSRDNNLLPEESPPPFYWDPHETDPAKRFKGLVWTDDVYAPMTMDLYYSPNGVRLDALRRESPSSTPAPGPAVGDRPSSWAGTPSGRSMPSTWRAVFTGAVPWASG